MGPSDGIWFLCPQCGTANRPGKTACFLCGQRLDTAGSGVKPGAPLAPAAPAFHEYVNPYSPPPDSVSPALSFKISSLLMVIAVIAVCLGVAHENLILGIIQAVAVAPALAYTVIVAARNKARGRPMAIIDKVHTFLLAIVAVVVIAVSAIIAFVVTCFPVGYAVINTGGTGTWIIALVIGGIGAVAAAVFMTRFFLNLKRRRG